MDIDPEVAALHRKLGEINQKLMRGDLVDNSIPEWERSPSPEPTYDRMGNRTNTREVRAREKMQQDRIDVIEELIAKCPTYRCVSYPLPLSHVYTAFAKANPVRTRPRSNSISYRVEGVPLSPRFFFIP